MTDKTSLGDRMKMYEEKRAGDRLIPLLPVIVRLDGRAFHTWTTGLERPFDENFVRLMQNVTQYLVEQTGAIFAHTQSDEISLLLYSDNVKSQIYFDGRISKILSVLTSECTAQFNLLKVSALDYGLKIATKPDATFDCRVFEVPNMSEAANYFIWRERDAVRNSILSTGQAHFSHKELHGKNTDEIQEMLFQEKGINWGRIRGDLKRGMYYKKITSRIPYTCEELDRLPPKHEARSNPDLKVKRKVVRGKAITLIGIDPDERIEVISGQLWDGLRITRKDVRDAEKYCEESC